MSTGAGPNVAVWVSKLSFDIWKVTTVLALTVSVAGNMVNSSTPPGALSPRLTVLAGTFVLAAFRAALMSAVACAVWALASCLAAGSLCPPV